MTSNPRLFAAEPRYSAAWSKSFHEPYFLIAHPTLQAPLCIHLQMPQIASPCPPIPRVPHLHFEPHPVVHVCCLQRRIGWIDSTFGCMYFAMSSAGPPVRTCNITTSNNTHFLDLVARFFGCATLVLAVCVFGVCWTFDSKRAWVGPVLVCGCGCSMFR